MKLPAYFNVKSFSTFNFQNNNKGLNEDKLLSDTNRILDNLRLLMLSKCYEDGCTHKLSFRWVKLQV